MWNVFQYLFIIVFFAPIVLIVTTIILALIFKDKSSKIIEKFFFVGYFIVMLLVFSLFGIAVPGLFLSTVFENGFGIALVIAFILFIWLIITTVIKLKNRIVLIKYNEPEVYVRDVAVEYSPAVLSYLINNKIETNKDLSATLLDLCTKNVVSLEQGKEDKIKINDLHNTSAVEQLPPDEICAYNMFISGIDRSGIAEWKSVVEKEYKKHKFSKPHKTDLSSYLYTIYFACFITVFILICGGISIDADFLMKALLIGFFSVWESVIAMSVKSMFTKNLKPSFVDSYTRKGAIELNRWKKFKKFMEEYTLVKDKDYNDIVILGKYLSYSIALGINKNCDSELYRKIEKDYSFNLDKFINYIAE